MPLGCVTSSPARLQYDVKSQCTRRSSNCKRYEAWSCPLHFCHRQRALCLYGKVPMCCCGGTCQVHDTRQHALKQGTVTSQAARTRAPRARRRAASATPAKRARSGHAAAASPQPTPGPAPCTRGRRRRQRAAPATASRRTRFPRHGRRTLRAAGCRGCASPTGSMPQAPGCCMLASQSM